MLLSEIPLDVLQRCLGRVSAADVLRIFLCGSPRLQQRLFSEPIIVDFELHMWTNPSKLTTRIPRLVQRLQFLRSFKLTPSHPNNPPRDVHDLALADLPASLRYIHIECSNVGQLTLQQEVNQFTFLQGFFPSLESVFLKGTPRKFGTLQMTLDQMPSSLKSFSMPDLVVTLGAMPKFCQLTRLHVSSLDLFSKQKWLPATLLHLTLENWFEDEDVLAKLLPEAMQSLIFTNSNRLLSPEFTQALPRGLLDLTAPIRAQDQSLKGLPASLTTLRFSRATSPCEDFFTLLPRALRYLDCVNVAPMDMSKIRTAPRGLQSLKLGNVDFPIDLPRVRFPPHLEKLTILAYPHQPHAGVIASVPHTVTALSIGIINLSAFRHLPKYLTRLHLNQARISRDFAMALPPSIVVLKLEGIKLEEEEWPVFHRGIRTLELIFPFSFTSSKLPLKWPATLQHLHVAHFMPNDDDLLNLPTALTYLEISHANSLTEDCIPILSALPLLTLILKQTKGALYQLHRWKPIPSLFIEPLFGPTHSGKAPTRLPWENMD